MRKNISVIMSIYKEPLKWVSESINSILNQTFKDFEFFIINDNPNRKELQEFLKKYKKQDKRIILIQNKKNLGLTKSLNIALKKSKGKYIARMDADDISLPNRLKIQYEYLEKNKRYFLCASKAILIDEENNKIVSINILYLDKVLPFILKNVGNILIHPTIFFRNEGFRYNERFLFAQDYYFYLKVLKCGKKISIIKEPLIKYRKNQNSITNTKKDICKKYKILARNLNRKKEKNLIRIIFKNH